MVVTVDSLRFFERLGMVTQVIGEGGVGCCGDLVRLEGRQVALYGYQVGPNMTYTSRSQVARAVVRLYGRESLQG